jgi:hypothetical protein
MARLRGLACQARKGKQVSPEEGPLRGETQNDLSYIFRAAEKLSRKSFVVNSFSLVT